MASVSMLLYIEECVYIYRKVSNNKKSAIIWVNGAAPVSEDSLKLKCMMGDFSLLQAE